MSTIKESKTTGTEAFVECPTCHSSTRHSVERAVDWSEYYEEPGIHAYATLQILRCNGCDTFSFRSIESNSEDIGDDVDGRMVLRERAALYPERPQRSIADELYLREDVYNVPEIIQAVYRETLAAAQGNFPTLVGIGIRAVVEAVCKDLKVKKRNLEQRIDELVKKAMLTPDGANILHRLRHLGNEAAHDMKPPTQAQIGAALKVIDHLLLGVYVLPKEASILPHGKKVGSVGRKARTKGSK
ncbi:MAG: DUF4145 domain-containing protein [Leptospirales bacterium]|nr:DUF4145 domain-containing protein [Leptospirales bacterium]